MMESLYGNGLVLLGLWVSMSLVMLFIWGLLAWAVVSVLSRRRFRRTWAGATGYRNSHNSTRPSAMTRGVALGPREDGAPLMKSPQPDWIRSCRPTALHDLMRVDEIGRRPWP
jgi:hypothetical protein